MNPKTQKVLLNSLLGGVAFLFVMVLLTGLALLIGGWVGIAIGFAIKAARFVL